MYKAPSCGLWSENEIDYILVLQKDVDITVNSNEVEKAFYVNQNELRNILSKQEVLITPWFKLICEKFLFQWWKHLSNLSSYIDNKIHDLR